jgi:Xaa-Pro aminopeptidase
VSPPLAQYLAGTYNPIRTLITDRPVLVLVPAAGPPVLFAHAIERTLLEREQRAVVYYEGGFAQLAATVAGVLRERELTGPVGVELDVVPAAFATALGAALPGCELTDAAAIFAAAIAVKSPEHVRAIAAAALATDRAQWKAFRSFRPGWTELDLGRALKTALIAEGAENIAFLTLGSGPRSVALHERPSPRVPRPGELVRVDFGGVFGGWCSDLAKTVSVTSPGERRRAVHRLLREILDRHIDRLRPGTLASDAHHAVAEDFAAAGLRLEAGHVGHGLGLDARVAGPGARLRRRAGAGHGAQRRDRPCRRWGALPPRGDGARRRHRVRGALTFRRRVASRAPSPGSTRGRRYPVLSCTPGGTSCRG